MVGVMPVSQPFFAMGRNPVSAWGGTAMRALSSSMYDVSGLGPDEISERTETLKSRFGGEREITVRETQWGPIISDVPPLSDYDLPPTVLRWTGHLASDEVTSMLAANRARNFAEFRTAFADYGQAAMNMLYAGTNGEIGHVLAARLPRREMRMPTDIIVDPAEFEPAWQSLADASTLPAALNPEIGFIANGNNRPAEIEIPIGVFFSTNDRIERMQQIMEEKGKVSVDDIKAMQEDVYMHSSVRLRDALTELRNDGTAA